MAYIGHALDHGECFQAVDRAGGLDQSRCRHHFDFAGERRAADFEEAVRLIDRGLQELVDGMQIHQCCEPPNGLTYESCRTGAARAAFPQISIVSPMAGRRSSLPAAWAVFMAAS